MAKFSLGGDDGEGPSNNNNKRLPKRPLTAAARTRSRTTTSAAAPRPTPSQIRSVFSDSEEDDSPTESSQFSSEEDDADDVVEVQQFQRRRRGEANVQPTEAPVNSTPQVQPTEAPVNSTPTGNRTAARESTALSPVVTLTEPDVLDCPICLDSLIPPVYQCENGHAACASCCVKMANKCGSCSLPIGYNRCRALEKVLEAAKISCRHTIHGCKELLNYTQKLNHEKYCKYTPCVCPHSDCNFVGISKSLYSHFILKHSISARYIFFNSVFSLSLDENQTHVFLQEGKESVVFVLNRCVEPLGSCVNVVCIGPPTVKGFLYEVTARDGDCSIVFSNVVENTREWKATAPMKRCVMVPTDMSRGVGQQLKLKIRIWRDHE